MMTPSTIINTAAKVTATTAKVLRKDTSWSETLISPAGAVDVVLHDFVQFFAAATLATRVAATASKAWSSAAVSLESSAFGSFGHQSIAFLAET